MKKIWKLISSHKLIILLVVMVVLGAFAFVSMKSFLYPSDENTVYGDRLEGITEVKISDERKQEVITLIKENKDVTSVTVGVKGKIINVYVIAKTEANTKEIMQELVKTSLSKFTEDELVFYDFQFFINNKDANYNAIGYKNKSKQEISWESDVIVSEEKTNEETE